MKHAINPSIKQYQALLNEYPLHETYQFLVSYMNQLQRHFREATRASFKTKQVLNGYLDYTYFYFMNDQFQEKGLKLGIVLNHQTMCFELWLMGNTKQTQTAYWNHFKDTRWNNNVSMPQWYIISVTLVSDPDFDTLDMLSNTITQEALDQVTEIARAL